MATHFIDTSCHFPSRARNDFDDVLSELEEKPLAPIRGLVIAILWEGALALSAIAAWAIWRMLW